MKFPKLNVDFIKSVRNPLGFYAFAILIIYASMTIILTITNLESNQIFIAFIIMSFLFFVIILSVTIITIYWPRHLYENIVKDMEPLKELKEFVNSKAFVDTIKDIIEKNYRVEIEKE